MRPIERRSGARTSYAGRTGVLLLLAVAPAALLHVLVATRGAGAPAGPAEAMAVAAAHGGGASVSATDVVFVRVLAVAQSLLPPVDGAGLVPTARVVCLLAGLLTALLLWPVARRLLPDGDAAAAAVAVAGCSPLALLLHAEVDAGAFAALWLVAAAAVGTAAGPRTRPAAVALAAILVGAAVITAPLAAAGVLAFAAHVIARGLPAFGDSRTARYLAAGVAGVTAAVVAVLALVRTQPSGSADAVGEALLVAVLLVGAALVATAAWRAPQLRPVATAAAVWLACAGWSGSARSTALLLAAPLVALLAGALVGGTAPAQRAPVSRPPSVTAAAAVGVALVAGIVTALWPFGAPPTASYRALAQWVDAELDPAVPVQADPLERAELVAAGVPAARFAAGPPAAAAVRVVPAGTGCVVGERAVAVLPAAGGRVTLCRPGGDVRPDGDAQRAIGVLLAANPRLTAAEPARRALAEGRVDPRLVVVLAGAMGTNRITVTDFPAAPGAPEDPLRRSAVVSASAPAGPGSGQWGAAGLEAYLAAQQPPFRPDTSRRPDGTLLVHFRITPSTAPS